MTFLVLPQHGQFYPEGLSVFAHFPLGWVGLASTDCNFQGLSRP